MNGIGALQADPNTKPLCICNETTICIRLLQLTQESTNMYQTPCIQAGIPCQMMLLPISYAIQCAMAQTQLLHWTDADLELEVTQDAPQKNMARAGSVIIPMTTFVLANLACMTGDDISCHVPAHANGTPAEVWRHASGHPPYIDIP